MPKIEDSYAYNGEGLRTSQTVSGTTTYMAWDMAEELPLILSDGTNSYIYGPDGLPVEQINNSTGTVLYLHHDQQGSTRLLTGPGKNEGAYTYTPYGAVQEHTGTATTPLGYDGQYTSSDTGLIYMRARVYDPTTAQFLTVDPIVPITRAPYAYVNDNPLNHMDRTGLCSITLGRQKTAFLKYQTRSAPWWNPLPRTQSRPEASSSEASPWRAASARSSPEAPQSPRGRWAQFRQAPVRPQQAWISSRAPAEEESRALELGLVPSPVEVLALLFSGPLPVQLLQELRRSVSRRAA